jgi:protein tyrosine phosphatase
MRNRKMTQLMSKQSFYNHKLAMHAPGSDLNIMTIARRRALEFKAMADKDDGNRLLVHCSAGVSRSPAIVVVHWLVCSKREKSVTDWGCAACPESQTWLWLILVVTICLPLLNSIIIIIILARRR